MRPRITRRSLLLGGAAASTAALGAGTALKLAAPADGARVMSHRELRILEAVAEVMFPGEVMPIDGIEAQVAAEVDRVVSELMDPVRTAAFRYVLRALEWGTLASRGRFFTDLDRETRGEVLATWSEPTFLARRVAGDSLKVVLGMAYFAHPEVLAHIGWRATCGGGPV